jgi:hypothetical protein
MFAPDSSSANHTYTHTHAPSTLLLLRRSGAPPACTTCRAAPQQPRHRPPHPLGRLCRRPSSPSRQLPHPAAGWAAAAAHQAWSLRSSRRSDSRGRGIRGVRGGHPCSAIVPPHRHPRAPPPAASPAPHAHMHVPAPRSPLPPTCAVAPVVSVVARPHRAAKLPCLLLAQLLVHPQARALALAAARVAGLQ